jgi:hypothetical protein
VLRGSVELNGAALSAGDAAAVTNEAQLSLKTSEPNELLLFDLS